MKVTAEQKERTLRLKLHGELDHHGAKRVMEEIDYYLDTALPLYAELDFGGVSFMDSSGIAVVLRLYKRMKNLGGGLKLTEVPPQAMRVFKAAGICGIVEIKEGEQVK